MTYAEKLRNPKWQQRRLEIFARDNWTCQLCGDKETEMHLHHKSYQYGKDPWEYEDENFVSLCKYCHSIVEFYKKEKLTVVKTRRTGYYIDGPGFMVSLSKGNGCGVSLIYVSDSGDNPEEVLKIGGEKLSELYNFLNEKCRSDG